MSSIQHFDHSDIKNFPSIRVRQNRGQLFMTVIHKQKSMLCEIDPFWVLRYLYKAIDHCLISFAIAPFYISPQPPVCVY